MCAALMCGVALLLSACSGSGASAAAAPQPGTLGFAVSAVVVNQSSGTVVVSVARTGGSGGAVSVAFATSNGSATAGTDYTATAGTLSWANGDAASKTIAVPVVTAPFFAGSRTFTVMLSGAAGNATLGTASEVVTVTGTLLPPVNYFSFSGGTYTFKLGLPIDQYGGTGGTNGIQYAATEASNAQIAAGFVDTYFYADTATYGGATNHVVFVAPSTGAVTTPGTGSDHTRSELRELYNGTGADANGDWTSAIGGTLTASCVVQAVSVDSDEATIGQVHNQSYVFALLLYRPALKDIAFDLYTTYGGSAHVRTSMVSNVNLGDAVTYSIAYKNSAMTVTVNGVTQTFAVDASWAGTPMYFKLGAYHAAPSTGNPAGDKTQTAFSSFAISH